MMTCGYFALRGYWQQFDTIYDTVIIIIVIIIIIYLPKV